LKLLLQALELEGKLVAVVEQRELIKQRHGRLLAGAPLEVALLCG
jgi:hypothetical protein